MAKTVIIGGVAGGASAAARLRRMDEEMEIIMLERGGFISYANCGLPYYIGGEILEKSALSLQTPQSFKSRFNVDVRIMSEAVRIDREAKTVTVKKTDTGEIYEESYDKLILSPGAEPLKLPIPGADLPHVFSLRTIPDSALIKGYVQEGVKQAVIIGGGFIGVEVAENLHSLGVEVTIVEMAEHLIASLDYDMACEVHSYLRKKGVKVITGKSAEEIKPYETVLSDGSIIPAQLVISAAGVAPESALAKDCGLELGVKGAIVTNQFMRTSDADIYAVGDAVEVTSFVSGLKTFIPLAGPANKQGRIAADNIYADIFGAKAKGYKGTLGTSVLKIFDMTAASVGLNEAALISAGIEYLKSYNYSASHATYYPGAEFISIKLLFAPLDGKILGAQLVGFSGVDKRCDIIATAMRGEMTVRDLTSLELAYAPPFSSAKDPVNMAGYVAENMLDGLFKVYYWHDVEALDPEKVTLLDVRTPYEFSRGIIPNTVNIQLDELRAKKHELDKSKPVYINCQSGLRGYYACRILQQQGYDCLNMSGGYRLWKIIKEDKAYSK